MKLLVAVAHPDDESFGCGSVLARAHAGGDETVVVCASRGEAGESRVATSDLAALREAELRAAAEVLGVGEVVLLDHRDSGMDGPVPDGSVVAAGVPTLAAELAAAYDRVRPDVVVTLDASDGHRDHVVVRDAALAAADLADHSPAAIYLVCLARSSMRRWAAHMQAIGGGEAYLGQDLGTPDDEITNLVDMRAVLDVRWAAIRAHASQASPYDDLPTSLQDEFLATDRLLLAMGDDVLAGW